MTEPDPRSTRNASLWIDALSLGRRIRASGLPHFLLALVSIQGASYLAQFAIARLVSPADFGIVRTVEATLGLALIVATAGIPSLAIKSIAAMPTPALQGRLLRRLLSLVAITSAITACVLVVGAPSIVATAAQPWLARLAFLLVPMSLARTAINFFQGIRQVQRISLYVACAALAGVATITHLVATRGLAGWIGGRYLGELMIAAVAAALCWRYIRLDEVLPVEVHPRLLLSEGVTLSLSLLVRAATDNVPVLALGWFAVAASDIGFFGLASLVAAALLLLPGALNSLALAPLVAALRNESVDARRLLLRLHAYSALLTVPLALLLLALLPVLLRSFAPAFLPGVHLLQALLLVVPLRGATTTSGGAMFAAGKVATGLRFNLLVLACSLGSLVLLVPSYGAAGAVGTIVMTEVIAALLFTSGAWRALAKSGGPSN